MTFVSVDKFVKRHRGIFHLIGSGSVVSRQSIRRPTIFQLTNNDLAFWWFGHSPEQGANWREMWDDHFAFFFLLGSSIDDVAKKMFYYVLLLFKIKKIVEGLDTAIILKKNNQNQLKRNLLNLECPTPFRSPTKSLRSALINEIPQVWKL